MGNCLTTNKKRQSGGDDEYFKVDYSSYATKQQQSSRGGAAASPTKELNELRDPFSTEKLETTETTTSSSEQAGGAAAAPKLQLGTPETASSSPGSKSSLSPTPLAKSLGFDGRNINTSSNTDSVAQQLALSTSVEQEAGDVVSPLGTFSHKSSLSSNSPRRKGRALQARLQKARHMQLALTAPGASLLRGSAAAAAGRKNSWSSMSGPERSVSSRSLASLASLGGSSSGGGGGSIDAATNNHSDSESLRSKTSGSHHSHRTHSAAKTASNAPPWAELALDSAVLCTALSRTKATRRNETPPLHICAGTESGSVVVREILDTNTSVVVSADPTGFGVDAAASLSSKLGAPVVAKLGSRVRSVDFSPDGQYLAVGGDDCKCTIFGLAYGEGTSSSPTNSNTSRQSQQHMQPQLAVLQLVAEFDRVDRVYAVQFSPDSRYLAIAGFDGTVAVLATEDIGFDLPLQAVAEIPREGLIMTLDWSPDGRYLAIGGSDKCCAIVDCQTSWKVFREIRRSSTIQALKWFPTGKYLAISCSDTVAIVVGRDSFALMNEIVLRETTRRGKRDKKAAVNSMYRSNSVCWSPNGSYFCVGAGANNESCTIYETKTFTAVHKIPRQGNVTCVVWGQQNTMAAPGAGNDSKMPQRYLAIGGEDRNVVIMKAGLETTMSGDVSLGGDDMSSSAASSSYFSSRGDWVLRDNAFRDVEDVKEISIAAPSDVMLTNPKGEAKVIAVAFSKGSKSRPSAYFAHSASDGLVTVRYCTDWKIVAEIQFPKPVETMTFSNGSRYLVLGCVDSNVYVSDTSSNWELVAKIEFAAPISCLCFSGKNNDRLAVGSVDGTFAFLDPNKGYDFAGEIESSNSPVVDVDWTSRNLAIGRVDGTVAVYDSNGVMKDSYNVAADLERNAPVRAVSFGVSSRFLAVGDAEGLVGIYSSKGGWVLCHQVLMDRCISSVLWSPDGRFLAHSSENGAVKVIDTIFWSDIGEAESASPPSDDGLVIRSGLAFSQNGHLLAFSRSDRGLGIMDSTKGWAMSLNLLSEEEEEPQRESDHDGATSLSSHGVNIPKEEPLRESDLDGATSLSSHDDDVDILESSGECSLEDIGGGKYAV